MVSDAEIVAGVSVVLTSLTSAVLYLFRENDKIKKEAARQRDEMVSERNKCERQLAETRVELVSLNALIEQSGWSGSTSLEGIVVTNAEGTIVEWNPGATILLHWTAREILGKNCTLIIPPAFRSAHSAAMASLRSTEDPPRRGPFQFHAQTKEGLVIPVEVTLSGWKVGNTRFVAASMRRRLTISSTIPDSDNQDVASAETGVTHTKRV